MRHNQSPSDRALDLRDLLADTDAVLELSNPHPLFSTSYYLQQRPDLRSVKGMHPLQHYLQYGAAEGVNPHPLFDTKFYLGQCDGDADAVASPLTHFLERGWQIGLDPHPLFSVTYYLDHHPEVAAAGTNPLLHVLTDELAASGDVSPWFSGSYYLTTNPDLAGSDMSPLYHYFRFGIAEGRVGSPLVASLLAEHPDFARPFGVLDLALSAQQALSGVLQSRNISTGIRRDTAKTAATFTYRPPISLLLHVAPDIPASDVWATVESVVQQVYPEVQLCVAVASNSRDGAGLTAALGARHPSIATARLGSDQDAATALNVALAMASGHFIGVIEPGDRLHSLALFKLVGAMQDGEPVELVYGDEDVVDEQGRHSDAFLKPGWSPEYLLSTDYLTRLGLYRTPLIRRLGGWRPAMDPGFDLALRASRVLSGSVVRHVPSIVYHRKQQTNGRKQAGRQDRLHRTVRTYLAQEGLTGDVVPSPKRDFQRVILRARSEPLVSVVIPTGNASFAGPLGREWTVSTCIEGLLNKTSYKRLEIIVVHDGNLLPQQEEKWRGYGVRLVAFDRPAFNFSRKINLGVAASMGEYVVILNDDTEPKRADWLEIMLGYAERPGVGVVGCKLFFPDGCLQHTGIVMQDGVAGHTYYRANGDDPGLHEMNMVARNCLAVTGACQLVRRSVFDAVGGYDEQLPLNFNDVDFCLRILDRGYRIVQAAAAEMFHFEGISKEILTGARLTKPDETQEFRSRWRHRYPVDPFYHVDLPSYMPQGWTALQDSRPTPSQARRVKGAENLAASGVNFLGPVNRLSGLGTAARSYIAALQCAGSTVHHQPMDQIYRHQALVESGLPSAFQDFPITLVQANADATPAVIACHSEDLRRAAYRIGVWVWELPAAGAATFDALRQYDEIWVPTRFNQDAYQPLTRSPVNVVPYALVGLPDLTAEDAAVTRQSLGIPRDALMLLYMFDTHSLVERKNPICLLDAFEAEFRGRDDVVLVLKVSYFDHLDHAGFPASQRFRRRLQAVQERCPNVRLIKTIMPQDDLYRLINATDIYVSPHRSEGFGLTVAEAMFYGKTVIATDFSGTQDMVQDTTGLKLNYDLIELAEDVGPYRKGNIWADPSVEHLRELMQRAVDDAGLRARLGKAGAGPRQATLLARDGRPGRA